MKNKFLRSTFAGATALAFLASGVSAQQIYWTNDAGHSDNFEQGSIWTMSVGGTATEIISGLNRPIGVAVGNGTLYWAEDGVDADTSRIARSNLDGSGISTVFDGQTTGFTNAQKIAVRGGTLYWSDFGAGIMSGGTDGTGFQVHGGLAGAYTAIDIHDGGDHIFYGEPSGDIGLYRMDLDGANDQLVHQPMAEANWRFNTLAVDQATGQIYYGDAGENAIKRRDHGGGNEVTIATDAMNVHGITMFDGEIYWAGRDGVIGRVAAEPGSTSEILADDLPTDTMFGIAVIPEPSTYALIFGGVIGLLVMLRRRFRK